MPRPTQDLTGRRFGRLTVLSRAPKCPKVAKWRCRCDCGKETVANSANLRSGHTQSCGCLSPELTRVRSLKHRAAARGAKTREFITWLSMIQRCEDPKQKAYPRYGGRGIKVCDRWRKSFAAFFTDLGPRPSGKHSIGRIDNDGNYEPGNVRWETRKQQGLNKRTNRLLTAKGETMSMTAWAERVGVPMHRIRDRLSRGWSHEDAIFRPA